MATGLDHLYHLRRGMNLDTARTMAGSKQHSTQHLRMLGGLIDELAATVGRPDGPRAVALAAVLDSIDVVVFAMSRSSSLVYLNAAWERLSGYPEAQTRGTSLMNYVHPRDQAAVSRYVGDEHRDEEGIVARWLARDGSCLRLNLRICVLNGGAEQAGFVGTLTDVTRRVLAEDVRQASHRTLSILINNLPGMVYRGRNNPDWTMEFVSQGAAELTGYQPRDLINNRRLAYGALIVEADRQQVWDSVQAGLRENRPFELTYRIRTAQGTEKWVLERGRGNFSASGELLGLEGFITDITEEKRAELRLQRENLYETPTGLPTRLLFMDRLERALLRSRHSAGCKSAVMLVSLDRFATLRATHGAERAERLAADVGRRFQNALHPVDSLSRWRQDEFAVLLDEADDARAVAQRLKYELRFPIVDGDTEAYITASIGIALGRSGYASAEEMMRDAAAAMARAKELGGARVETADRTGGMWRAAPSSIEEELAHAVDNAQFALGFSPVIAIATNSPAAVDVQLFWEHPRRGRLPAWEFFSIAEHLPMVKALKGWYINALLAQAAAFRDRLVGNQPLRMHAEIAGRCMLEPGFLGRMVTQLRAAAGPRVPLALEISESMLRDCVSVLRESLAVLRAQDIAFIIDVQRERGSTLEILPELPVYALRLDEALLRGGDGEAGAGRSVTATARESGVHLIARCPADVEAPAAAHRHACDFYQAPPARTAVDLEGALRACGHCEAHAAGETLPLH
jgi:diguanylate cyclase (GGDEF)-like protein/PAS domain S-box-containing protein